MQPTYLPWMGYFAMMRSVDLFVYLDTVQFAHRSWQQRNRIRVEGGETWLSVPVTRPHGQQTRIDRVVVNYDQGFPASHIGLLKSNYRLGLGFSEVVPGIESILEERVGRLSHLNVRLCEFLADAVGVKTPTTLASNLDLDGQKADLLLNICQSLGASEYVSAPGSAVYLNSFSGFEEAGIELEYFTFSHPEYEQRYSPFVSHLSVVDAIANQGAKWVASKL